MIAFSLSAFLPSTFLSSPLTIPYPRPKICMTTSPPPQTATTIAQNALLSHLQALNLGRNISNNSAAIESTDNQIQQLEALNPSSSPTRDERLGGTWRLIYSTSRQVTGAGKPHWLQPKITLQYVNSDEGTFRNEEVLEILGGLIKWRNSVDGVIEVVNDKRINVKFKEFDINGLFKVKAPKRFRGWQEITYLDDGLRIARGNLGNVFVMVKDD